MSLPASGELALTDIQAEFTGDNPIGLSEYYRGGYYVSQNNPNVPTSGTIAVHNFYSATRRIPVQINITASTYNFDVFNNRGPSYVTGYTDVTVVVPAGVIVGSTSAFSYAMQVTNSFSPTDTVSIVNNGVIQGMGGTGAEAQFGAQSGGNPGGGGGNALYLNRPTTIQNNAVIAGGGGGGGGGSGWTPNKGGSGWGGPGGGGAGFNGGPGGWGPSGNGGTGDSINGGAGAIGDFQGIYGGAGGGRGANGANGMATGGANPRPGGVGGTAGFHIVGNAYATWTSNGSRLGPTA